MAKIAIGFANFNAIFTTPFAAFDAGVNCTRKIMRNGNVKYICEQMLQLEWTPKISEFAAKILEECDSKLEQMYILGACYFIEKAGLEGDADGCAPLNIWSSSVYINDQRYKGIWVVEPWCAWYPSGVAQELQGGPSAIMFVPQYESPEKAITHDIAIFYGDDNGSPNWSLEYVVEVDGYGVHKDRREKDEYRDSNLSYKVLRFREESSDPKTWFNEIIRLDIEGTSS